MWQKGDDFEPSTSGRKKRKFEHMVEEEKELEEEPRQHKKQTIHFIYGKPARVNASAERKRWSCQLYISEVTHLPRGKKQRQETPFTDDDLHDGLFPQRDALVIQMDINDVIVHLVLVDIESSINVMYYDVFTKLGLPRSQVTLVKIPFSRFTSGSVEIKGLVLPVKVGTYPNVYKLEMEFIGVRLTCSHNVIQGRLRLEDLKAIISVKHLYMNFPPRIELEW